MIAWWLSTAEAVPQETDPCGPLRVVATSPGDGAVVPPDVVFNAISEPFSPSCGTPVLELFRGTLLVPASLWVDGSSFWRLVPDDPLLVGETYEFRVSDPTAPYAPTSVTVTVGDPPPPSPVPAELAFTAEPVCATGVTSLDADLTFPEPTTGLLVLDFRQGKTRDRTYVVMEDQTRIQTGVGLIGPGESCVSGWFEDLGGDLVWSIPETCAATEPCPTYGEPDSVTYTMEPQCEDDSTALHVEVDLPPAPAGALATLVVEVETDVGSLGAVTAFQLVGAEADTTFDLVVNGQHDVCFDLVLLGVDGVTELWRSGPWCSPEPLSCPDAPRSVASGCGCDQVGRGLGVVPWVGLALARVRRRR